MKRFRFTLLAICLILLWLGWTDVSLLLRNTEPKTIAIEDLAANGPPREWLHVVGGHQDLTEAISTSGSVELEAFLVPLTRSPQQEDFRVLVETRTPRIMDLLGTYYFKLEDEQTRERFLAEHREAFFGRREVTGMLVTGLVASNNRDKLMKLARQVGMDVPEDVIFIAEGKEPARWRGFIFLGLALAGLVKLGMMWRKKEPQPPVA